MLLALGACSSASDDAPLASSTTNMAETSITPAPPSGVPADATPVETPSAPAPVTIIGLEGLGDLRIGQPVPPGGSWAARGAQEGDACRTVTSPDYPGAYAIVTDGKVRRITVGKRSNVTLAEGIGPGASEAEARQWFAGFRAEPHKYEDAPAKYLTAPDAANGSSALRIEIGHDGKVGLIHVGTMPELSYVEGCS